MFTLKKYILLQITYKYSDHDAYFKTLASAYETTPENNTILLPPNIGTGYTKILHLPNGLQLLVTESVLNTDVHIFREQSTLQSYTLRFDQISNLKNFRLEIDEDLLKEEDKFYSGAILTSSRVDFGFTANAGSESRSINIHFTEDWFNKFSGVKTTDNFMQKYLELKTAAFTFEVLNIEYREIMEEIFELKENHPIYKTVIQNRIMLLLEKFLRNVFNKMNNEAISVKESEIKRLMQVESLLVANFSIKPPVMQELMRIGLMGETKLKACFKKTYGLSPYKYYQKSRMLKARQLLNTRKYAVTEVGTQLGFKNLSNFTIAYKKAFKVLPSSIN